MTYDLIPHFDELIQQASTERKYSDRELLEVVKVGYEIVYTLGRMHGNPEFDLPFRGPLATGNYEHLIQLRGKIKELPNIVQKGLSGPISEIENMIGRIERNRGQADLAVNVIKEGLKGIVDIK